MRAQIPHMTFTFTFFSYNVSASSFIKLYYETEVNFGIAQKEKDKPITQSLGYIPQLERGHGQDEKINPFSSRPLSLSTFH